MTQTRRQTLFWKTKASHWTIPPHTCPWESQKHNQRREFDGIFKTLWPFLLLLPGLFCVFTSNKFSNLIIKSNLFMLSFQFSVLCGAVHTFGQNRALKISPRGRRTSKHQRMIIFSWFLCEYIDVCVQALIRQSVHGWRSIHQLSRLPVTSGHLWGPFHCITNPPKLIHSPCKSNETARWRCMQLYVMPAFLPCPGNYPSILL